VFWVHIKGSIPTDGKIMLGTPIGYTGSKFVVFNPANDPGTYDTSGTVPSITGASTRSTGLPLLFLGRYTGPGHLAVIGLGDSIMDGYGDSKNPVIAGNGPLSRAAVDANGANTIATLNLTRSGETAKTWVNHHLRQAQILPFANVVVEEFATNDIGANNPDADANLIIARLESIWTTARDAGVQKIVRTRLLPRTTSASSNWLSKADQTPNLNWGPDGIRDTVNAHFQTALAQGKIDAVVDMLTPVADPTDNHYWLTNGTNDYMTSDGCHPRPVAHALMAAPLRAALLALTVDSAPAATEILIDNLAGAPLFTKSAGWSTGTAPGKYGSNYYHDGDTRDGAKYAFFSPDFTITGTYAVFVNWAPHNNRASNTPIEVIHAGGMTPFKVSQKTDGNWHPLGEFTFGPGGSQGVYIDNFKTDGYVIVDAVKFVPVP
jgi:lysophospholipase L1-like esterase